ncbi:MULTISPECIES: hypothetical protein [Olivibacter]|uniref:Uncharacterized protein n=1 Tax=Olivibacter oleidegradans TaxID=760123 RepID=A0ABV6HMC5_9SPHI|nr:MULTISPECIES: hypothetical protein [Olivibacter]MCL4638998.1 hypothetical protein [Olivibacter sp. UJ_SKK_5.1]MDX3915599.1 hypothetical protein [Pseudosphingobacterium sp.]QEL02772.1 hypothetical protein FKG96_18770 [Olivibacter sp. LS-1]
MPKHGVRSFLAVIPPTQDHRAERGNPKSGLLEHTVKQRKPKHGVRSFLAVISPIQDHRAERGNPAANQACLSEL